MFTQSLSSELAKDEVRVNGLVPGLIETRMTVGTREKSKTLVRFLNRIPMGPAGYPAELVGPAVFLSSSMADYVTGVVFWSMAGVSPKFLDDFGGTDRRHRSDLHVLSQSFFSPITGH